jgi:type II secretory pathway pseudopilin PulG
MAAEDHNADDDPWASARAAAREDVVAVLGRRGERICPECGFVQRESRRTCERCHHDLTVRTARWRPSRRQLIGAAIVAALAIAVAIPLISSTRKHASAERTAANLRQAKLVAAERARLTRDVRPVRAAGPPPKAGEDPVAHRTVLLARGQDLITADARARITAGTMTGPIKGTECTPFPHVAGRAAAERDPATPSGRYDCVAYKNKFEAPSQNGLHRTGVFGYPYWLVIDYKRSALVWCKITPRAGEGGRVLAYVPVPVPCRDPAGPG